MATKARKTAEEIQRGRSCIRRSHEIPHGHGDHRSGPRVRCGALPTLPKWRLNPAHRIPAERVPLPDNAPRAGHYFRRRFRVRSDLRRRAFRRNRRVHQFVNPVGDALRSLSPIASTSWRRDCGRRRPRRRETDTHRAAGSGITTPPGGQGALGDLLHYLIDFSMKPSVLAFSINVRTFARSRPDGTSASISSFSVTSLPGRAVSCSTTASTIRWISRAGRPMKSSPCL